MLRNTGALKLQTQCEGLLADRIRLMLIISNGNPHQGAAEGISGHCAPGSHKVLDTLRTVDLVHRDSLSSTHA